MVQDVYKRVEMTGNISTGGPNSYVVAGDAASLHLNNQMCFCIRLMFTHRIDSNVDSHTLVDKYDTAGGVTGFMVRVVGEQLRCYSDGGVSRLDIADFITYRTVMHIVVNYNSTTGNIEAYRNGVFVAQGAYPSLTQNIKKYVVGSRQAGNESNLMAHVYEVNLYNRYLTVAEIGYNHQRPNNPVRRGLVACYAQHGINQITADKWQDTSPLGTNNADIKNCTVTNYSQISAR